MRIRTSSITVRASNAGGEGSPANHRVLVVEDNRVNQLAAVRTLEKLGFRVDVVSNGLAALDAIAQSHYSVVLMDCQMPEMDGFQATEEIRRRQRSSGERTPVIALTTMSEDTARKRCLAAGMDDYLQKPIVLDDLVAILDRWVPGFALERAYSV